MYKTSQKKTKQKVDMDIRFDTERELFIYIRALGETPESCRPRLAMWRLSDQTKPQSFNPFLRTQEGRIRPRSPQCAKPVTEASARGFRGWRRGGLPASLPKGPNWCVLSTSFGGGVISVLFFFSEQDKNSHRPLEKRTLMRWLIHMSVGIIQGDDSETSPPSCRW